MMIVVPMLIQTLTFGWIFENLLGSQGTNAILLAGALLGCAAPGDAVGQPAAADEDSARAAARRPPRDHGLRPGDRRFGRLPSALYAVARAARGRRGGRSADGRGRRLRPGRPAARRPAESRRSQAALRPGRGRAAMAGLGPRAHLGPDPRHRAGASSPPDRPQALLRVAGSNPASLIVVGNRGLGADEGEVLGSVPGEIVKNAVCDVLIVQTSGVARPGLYRSDIEWFPAGFPGGHRWFSGMTMSWQSAWVTRCWLTEAQQHPGEAARGRGTRRPAGRPASVARSAPSAALPSSIEVRTSTAGQRTSSSATNRSSRPRASVLWAWFSKPFRSASHRTAGTWGRVGGCLSGDHGQRGPVMGSFSIGPVQGLSGRFPIRSTPATMLFDVRHGVTIAIGAPKLIQRWRWCTLLIWLVDRMRVWRP